MKRSGRFTGGWVENMIGVAIPAEVCVDGHKPRYSPTTVVLVWESEDTMREVIDILRRRENNLAGSCDPPITVDASQASGTVHSRS